MLSTSLLGNILLHCPQETLRQALTEEKDEIVHQLQQEKEELVSKNEAEKRELMEEILTLQQNREESLLLLENEKQKVRREARRDISRKEASHFTAISSRVVCGFGYFYSGHLLGHS